MIAKKILMCCIVCLFSTTFSMPSLRSLKKESSLSHVPHQAPTPWNRLFFACKVFEKYRKELYRKDIDKEEFLNSFHQEVLEELLHLYFKKKEKATDEILKHYQIQLQEKIGAPLRIIFFFSLAKVGRRLVSYFSPPTVTCPIVMTHLIIQYVGVIYKKKEPHLPLCTCRISMVDVRSIFERKDASFSSSWVVSFTPFCRQLYLLNRRNTHPSEDHTFKKGEEVMINSSILKNLTATVLDVYPNHTLKLLTYISKQKVKLVLPSSQVTRLSELAPCWKL